MFSCICHKVVTHPTLQKCAQPFLKVEYDCPLTYEGGGGGGMSWGPCPNNCMHFKWCTCNPMAKWSKGGSSCGAPCGMGSSIIACIKKIKVQKTFIMSFAFDWLFQVLGHWEHLVQHSHTHWEGWKPLIVHPHYLMCMWKVKRAWNGTHWEQKCNKTTLK